MFVANAEVVNAQQRILMASIAGSRDINLSIRLNQLSINNTKIMFSSGCNGTEQSQDWPKSSIPDPPYKGRKTPYIYSGFGPCSVGCYCTKPGPL